MCKLRKRRASENCVFGQAHLYFGHSSFVYRIYFDGEYIYYYINYVSKTLAVFLLVTTITILEIFIISKFGSERLILIAFNSL